MDGLVFWGFENGTLKPELRNEKMEALAGQLRQLEAESEQLDASRGRLELPPLDAEAFADLMDQFDEVFAAGSKAQ